MTEICLHPDFVLGLLNEIGRNRALSDSETDVVEAIVCRGHKSTQRNFRWTATADIELIQAAHTPGGIKGFADANGVSRKGAYDRLSKLRKAKMTANGVEG